MDIDTHPFWIDVEDDFEDVVNWVDNFGFIMNKNIRHDTLSTIIRIQLHNIFQCYNYFLSTSFVAATYHRDNRKNKLGEKVFNVFAFKNESNAFKYQWSKVDVSN